MTQTTPTTEALRSAIFEHTFALEFIIEAMQELLPTGTHGAAEAITATIETLRSKAHIDADGETTEALAA